MIAHEEMDKLIEAGTALLGIAVQTDWLPTIRANLEVTLRLAAMVEAFELPDEAEPAPVFAA